RVRQGGARLPGHDPVLRARLRRSDPLPFPHRARATGAVKSGECMMLIAESILLTIATAATPLLIAALGELVVERSGVLNLGVEGMMVMGAVCGFGAAFVTGSPWIGVGAGILAGVAMA